MEIIVEDSGNHLSFKNPTKMENKSKNLEQNPQYSQTDFSGSYYLVRYCGGSYDDFYSIVIFVTDKKSIAAKYCDKFNKILKRWKDYYKQFETDNFGVKWIADEHVEKYFDRWISLRNITKCYYEEVPFR